jgi:hypothetical protein
MRSFATIKVSNEGGGCSRTMSTANGMPVPLSVAEAPQHGHIELDRRGSATVLTYTPTIDYVGHDRIVFNRGQTVTQYDIDVVPVP